MAKSNSSKVQSRVVSALNRNVFVICLLAFIGDFTGYMVDPTFTLFALSIGASMTFIGVLSSISSAFSVLMSIPFGGLSDKSGRKPFLLIWRATSPVAHFTYYAATSFWHLIPGRFFMGLGGSASQVSVRSYLADVTHPSKLHVSMALFTLSMGLGVIFGPLLGGRLADVAGFRLTYLAAGLIGLAGVLAVVLGVKNREVVEETVHTGSKRTLRENLKMVVMTSAILSVILLSSLNNLAYQVVIEYVPVHIVGLGFSTVVLGDLFFVRGIATAAIRLPVGLASKRLGTWRLMIISLAMEAAGIFAFPYSRDYLFQAALMVIVGVGYGIFLTTSATQIMLVTPAASRGVALGVMGTVSGILSTIYGPLRGLAADIFGIGVGLMIMGAVVGAGTLLIVLLSVLRWDKRQSPSVLNVA